eukprot:CAMPEP_0197643256 /NCGR_PEP_ID=MMETSP1338-20131121/16646_1 /TAXON_ID=43686 ORGANISM="Pelagodinium beii, Strain RCC1491" /NCGR_SAMPLE_ID=MMETSP1338 /ASSEMBLY_ACC=CAM_ASM_000754 /LENGTH=122 /DNA_ID=CAMNT_0043216493 /DNA_START=105 /DNA_END=474 /DNA_ORIENTATION=+
MGVCMLNAATEGNENDRPPTTRARPGCHACMTDAPSSPCHTEDRRIAWKIARLPSAWQASPMPAWASADHLRHVSLQSSATAIVVIGMDVERGSSPVARWIDDLNTTEPAQAQWARYIKALQ